MEFAADVNNQRPLCTLVAVAVQQDAGSTIDSCFRADSSSGKRMRHSSVPQRLRLEHEVCFLRTEPCALPKGLMFVRVLSIAASQPNNTSAATHSTNSTRPHTTNATRLHAYTYTHAHTHSLELTNVWARRFGPGGSVRLLRRRGCLPVRGGCFAGTRKTGTKTSAQTPQTAITAVSGREDGTLGAFGTRTCSGRFGTRRRSMRALRMRALDTRMRALGTRMRAFGTRIPTHP